jgi:ATP-dependent Clp protease adaptor protein ClpS
MNPKDDARPPRDTAETGQEAPQPLPQVSTRVKDRPAPPRVERMPQFRVLLHNDQVSEALYVVEALCELTPLMPQRAAAVMMEAHRTGVALVLVTHQERAELYVDQFRSKRLVVTMEPAE